MSLQGRNCLVLILVGPDLPAEFVQDTLDSVAAFMPAEACAVCILDSNDDRRFEGFRAGDLPTFYVHASEVYEFPASSRVWAPLWLKQIRTLLLMRERFDFDIALRLDTDAVLTGPSPHLDVLDFIGDGFDIGMVGAFSRQGDGSSKAFGTHEVGAQLASELWPQETGEDGRTVEASAVAVPLLRLYEVAQQNGYALGYNCTGGAFFMTRQLVDRWAEMELQKLTDIRFARAADDWLFGLAAYAAGLRLSDGPGEVIAVNYRGLPAPPDEVRERGVKIYHPVKLVDDPGAQAEIRASLRRLREPPGQTKAAGFDDGSPRMTSARLLAPPGQTEVESPRPLAGGRARWNVDSCIAEAVPGLRFAEVGGLWGLKNEKVTLALKAGATSALMLDIMPVPEAWQVFRDRADAEGVSGYATLEADIDDPKLMEMTEPVDFVHCSGVIYHVPNPVHTLAQLARLTTRYLLLGSMTVPPVIVTGSGTLDLQDGRALYVPALSGATKRILSEHFDRVHLKVHNINSDQLTSWQVSQRISPNHEPWWWIWSAQTVATLAERAGFSVLRIEDTWKGRAHSLFCEKRPGAAGHAQA